MKVTGFWNAYHGNPSQDIQLDDRWRRKSHGQPPELTPGKYVVRIRLSITRKDKQTGLATSKRFEFEVIPTQSPRGESSPSTSGVSDLQDAQVLAVDLGLDSLALADVTVWLESEFAFPKAMWSRFGPRVIKKLRQIACQMVACQRLLALSNALTTSPSAVRKRESLPSLTKGAILKHLLKRLL